MEVKFNIRQVVMWRIVLFSGIISLICACSYSGKKVCPPFDISFSGHTLLAIAPGFTIKATEDTLNKTYPCLRSGKMRTWDGRENILIYFRAEDGNKGSIMILCGIRVKVPSVRKMGSFKPIQYGERKIYMFAGTLPLLTKIL